VFPHVPFLGRRGETQGDMTPHGGGRVSPKRVPVGIPPLDFHSLKHFSAPGISLSLTGEESMHIQFVLVILGNISLIIPLTASIRIDVSSSTFYKILCCWIIFLDAAC
jgi:hypothetical protein